MLTDEQVIACLSHEGDRVAMLNAAYRLGMMRAAKIAEHRANGRSDAMVSENVEARKIGKAIRAEAGETSEPRKGE